MKTNKKATRSREAKVFDPHPGQRPLTRREFIARGLMTGGAAVLTPGLFSWVARSLEANEPAIRPNLPSGFPRFITFDMAGGCNLAGSNFLVGGAGGQLDLIAGPTGDYGVYRKLGLLPREMVGMAADTSFGIAMHPGSAFLKGMKDGTTPITRSHVDGFVIAAVSADDSASNRFNVASWVARVGNGGFLGAPIGVSDSYTGGNSASPDEAFSANHRSLRIRSTAGAQEMAGLGQLAVILESREKREAFYRFSRRLSEKQIERFVGLGVNEQIRTALGLSVSSLSQLEGGLLPSQVDPLQDRALRGNNDLPGGPMAQMTAGDPRILFRNESEPFQNSFPYQGVLMPDSSTRNAAAAVSKLVLDGFASAGTLTTGGNDYHGNQVRTLQSSGTFGTDNVDYRNGWLVGQMLEAARRKQQPLMIHLITDGAVGSGGALENGNQPEGEKRLYWSSDSGEVGASVVLLYHPQLEREGSGGLVRHPGRQLGRFKSSGNSMGVDLGSHLTSNNPSMVGQVVVLNFLGLLTEGLPELRTEFTRVTGLEAMDQLDQYLFLKNL